MPIRRARCGRCQAKSADNTGCCKGERRQWRKQRTEAGAAVAECEGLLPPKHDAGTATRHYRAFWQRRCRAAAAGAVLKPQGGNCAVLPMVSGTPSSCTLKVPRAVKLFPPLNQRVAARIRLIRQVQRKALIAVHNACLVPSMLDTSTSWSFSI